MFSQHVGKSRSQEGAIILLALVDKKNSPGLAHCCSVNRKCLPGMCWGLARFWEVLPNLGGERPNGRSRSLGACLGGVTPGLCPFASLCFPSTKRWAATATWSCSHDPGWWTEISDTVSSNKTPLSRSCFYLFCHGADKLTHVLTFLCWANGDGTGKMSASDDNVTRLGSKMEEGVLWLQHPFPHPSPHLFMYHMGLNQIPPHLSWCSTFFLLIFFKRR